MELADLFVCVFVRSFVCLLGSFGLFGLFGAFDFLGLFVWFAWFVWLLWFVWFVCFVWNDHEGRTLDSRLRCRRPLHCRIIIAQSGGTNFGHGGRWASLRALVEMYGRQFTLPARLSSSSSSSSRRLREFVPRAIRTMY